jgi:hypothetical protein
MKISIVFSFNSIFFYYVSYNGLSLGICLPFMVSKSVGKTVKSVSSEFVTKKAFEIYNQNARLHLVV